jgi:metallo-beta-lactamase class B
MILREAAMKPIHTAVAIALVLAAFCAEAQRQPSWTEPVEPFRVIANVHYVGTADLTSFLITTPAGHVLLDAPLEENVPHILGAIRALGFDPADVEILISSHAHFDHAGGFARIKEATGARLLLSRADAALVERGGRDDFAFGDRGAFTPARVDGFVADGDVMELGGVRLRAVLTPGHTKGGTSWLLDVEEGGETYRVLFANSLSAPGYDLVGNQKYPTILDDYRASFDRLAAIEADVFLATHGSFFQLREKRAELAAREAAGEGPNPFVDREASKRYVERWRGIVEGQVLDQEAEEAVRETLDRFHQAAAEADAETYFSLLADEAVYLGTDAGERWSVDDFRAFAKPYFDRGQGWTYVSTSRHVDLDEDRSTAWFDEMLENASYGTTRGTGVLMKTPAGWRIVQYHLTIPIPNEIAKEVVERIRKAGGGGG